MSINSHRDLRAWQCAFQLGLQTYRTTAAFPKDERFGLVSQMRRAAVSVTSNIAEGYGRGSTQDYLRFLRLARGSLYELDTQLLYAVELGFLGRDQHQVIQQSADEVGRLLAGLIRSLDGTRKTNQH